MKKGGLTDKQAAFVHEYVRDKNATQAAIRAGYSSKTAASIGEENLRKPEIRKAVNAALAEVEQKSMMESERLRREIARIAFSDPRKIIGTDGRIKRLDELDDDTAAAVAAYEVDKDGVVKYKFWDKNSAQERASKILGEFEKDNRQRNPLEDLPRDVVKEIQARLAALR